jgi:lantibiotic modifying enzyme
VSSWRPLLPDDLASRALETAEAIAADLRHLASAAAPAEPLPLNGNRFSLAGGPTGQALFFAYLDRARPGEGYDETAAELLERAFEELAQADADPGFCSGFAGVAWAVEHLRGWLVDDEDEDPGAETAEALSRLLGSTPWPWEYDLISGLAGHGAYALERMPHPLGRECLESAVARLSEEAERGPQGISWWKAPARVSARMREGNPEGLYDLGLAHGNAGIIALLGQACAHQVAATEARTLLDGAVPWLLAHQNPPGSPSRFPIQVVPGQESGWSRVAWCYGDLGIAVALLVAARGAGEPDWERAALDLARSAAARSFESSGVADAGLCHGAGGNAHLFNRMFQATGDPALGQAARTWAERALDMRRPGEGIGGYLVLVPNQRLQREWGKDPGFLTGAAGIGLSLLAAATSIEPSWDRALLVEVPQGLTPAGCRSARTATGR